MSKATNNVFVELISLKLTDKYLSSIKKKRENPYNFL